MSFLRGACKGPRSRARGSISGLKVILIAVLVGALWVSTAARAGELDQVCTFNIPAQPLDKALLQFGAQAHVQLSISLGSAQAEHVTRTLKGSYTGKQALSALLLGTGLRYAVHGVTVEIRRRDVMRTTGPTGPSGNEHSSHRLLVPASSSDPSPDKGDPSPVADGNSRGWLHEVIVTAQKYSQRAFDVPISLDIVSGQELQQYGITDLSGLQYDVPGLYMNNTGSQHAIYLRGVGNTYGSGAMVGQYIDDADMTAEGFTGESGFATDDNGLYDLQRVEVLKGPQGTLYGDGSIGGVIRYITNKPVLNQFESNADVSAQFTEYGAPGQQLETMLNAPLVSGELGLRVAGLFEHDGGWVDEPAANLKNINGADLVDVRAEALWQPTARLKVNVMQIIHRHTYGLANGEDASGNFSPLFDTTLTQNAADDSHMSNITATFDADSVRLVSSSTYLNEDQNVDNNFNTFSGGYGILIPYSSSSNRGFSEELRLLRAGRGRWQWTVGGFYKHFHDTFLYPSAYIGLASSPLALASKIQVEDLGESSSSVAGFADTSYKLSGRLTVGGGLRYFSDRKTSNLTSLLLQSTARQAATFPSTDPRIYVQYEVTPNVNTYASASKGFRSGGFNSPPSEPYKPETLWSYDLGTKISFPSEGLRGDVDLFYMNYSNFVTVADVPPLYPDLNVGNARIEGVDDDLTWQVLDRWRLGLTTEILRTEFLTASALSGYAAGERLPFAPTYSFTASMQHSYRWAGKAGYVEVYYYETSRVQVRPPLAQSDVLRFLNGRVGIQWTEALRLGIFVHNLLNDRGNVSPEYISDESVRPRPRTFGVEFDTSLP
jgi:iron complex outermembrane recepter protein